MTVKERLKSYINYKKLSVRAFESSAGLSYGYVNNMRVSIQPDKVKNIAIYYPDLNTGWLLTGEGTMLKNEGHKIIENPNFMEVPLVNQYAYAGYLGGFDDPQYVEALPTRPFYIDNENGTPKGNYISIEVKGDSMNDGTAQSIREGDFLLCREVKKDLWQYKLHINKWDFLIVHKTEGIIAKRIINHDIKNCTITIHSLNPLYEDRVIGLDDIAQIFNIVQVQRVYKENGLLDTASNVAIKSNPEETNKPDNKIMDLQKELDMYKEQVILLRDNNSMLKKENRRLEEELLQYRDTREGEGHKVG